LAECSAQLIDQAVAQGVPFVREYSGYLSSHKIAEKHGNLFRMYEKITGISAYAEPMAWWKLGALTDVINLLIWIIVVGPWWKVIGIW
jgi:hypothetical protein